MHSPRFTSPHDSGHRRPATRHARRAATLAGALTLAAGMAVVLAPAASAADSTTLLDGVSRVGDVVAGGGKVYVAAYDQIIVADSTGAVVNHITGLSGALGMAISPDGSRLYAANSGGSTVTEIDTSTLAITGQINLAGYPCPSNLSLAGNVLWVGYGCGQWGGGVLGVDLSAATPAPVPVAANMYGAPLVAAGGGVLATGETGLSPGSVEVYDVNGTTATQHGTISGWTYNLSNLQDLAIAPDGSTVVSAFGSPYQFTAWDTGTLAPVRSYGSGSFSGYPDAVAVSPDGRYVAGGRSYGTDLSVYDAAAGTTIFSGDNTAGITSARAVTRSNSPARWISTGSPRPRAGRSPFPASWSTTSGPPPPNCPR